MARKTVDERIALIDEKIAKKKAQIKGLEQQKQKILHPVSMRSVLTKAKESGMSPEDIAKKLGIEL